MEISEKEKSEKQKRNYEMMRAKLWCDIAVAYTNSNNSVTKDAMITWANKAVDEFDEKFKHRLVKD